MSGHVLMRKVETGYEVTCEDCNYRMLPRYAESVTELMVNHALYHDRPRPKNFYTKDEAS
jgi:hypothetical protein